MKRWTIPNYHLPLTNWVYLWAWRYGTVGLVHSVLSILLTIKCRSCRCSVLLTWNRRHPSSQLKLRAKEKRGTSIFWQLWTQLPSERKWVQGVWSLRRKWDIVRVQTVIVVGDDVSNARAPVHWPQNADAGPHPREMRDGGRRPDGSQYFVTLATYFFAPLCAGSWYALIAQ